MSRCHATLVTLVPRWPDAIFQWRHYRISIRCRSVPNILGDSLYSLSIRSNLSIFVIACNFWSSWSSLRFLARSRAKKSLLSKLSYFFEIKYFSIFIYSLYRFFFSFIISFILFILHLFVTFSCSNNILYFDKIYLK